MASLLYRYIQQVQGVRSGHPIIEGTRIGVHDVVGLVLSGAGIDDVTRSLPPVTRAQVYECLAYYEDHKEAMDLLIARQFADDQERAAGTATPTLPDYSER